MARSPMTGITEWTEQRLNQIKASLQMPKSRIIHIAIAALFVHRVPEHYKGVVKDGNNFTHTMHGSWNAEVLTERLCAVANAYDWTTIEAMQKCIEEGLERYEHQVAKNKKKFGNYGDGPARAMRPIRQQQVAPRVVPANEPIDDDSYYNNESEEDEQ